MKVESGIRHSDSFATLHSSCEFLEGGDVGGESAEPQTRDNAERLRGQLERPEFSQRRYRNLYLHSMKSTLNLNDQRLADAKALAARQRTSLTRLIEEGLQPRLRANANSAKRSRIRLPVFKGHGGLVKGVNPLSNKALLEALGDDA